MLDSLVTLFHACLLDRVDSVLIHHGGAAILLFKNTARVPTDDGCSLFLAIREVRMRAADAGNHVKGPALDLVKPVVIAGCFTLVAAVISRLMS